jgi:hypothetical protein
MHNAETVSWSQTPVYSALRAIGVAMNGGRLFPETLQAIPTGVGPIIPDHTVDIAHVSGRELRQRKGRYSITIDGPRLSGRWSFISGVLEKIATDLARASEV